MSDISKWATWREIQSQPDIWEAWWPELEALLPEIKSWIAGLDITEVWFSGAGTSAYIGDFIAAGLNAQSPIPLRSVASTDLVAAPHQFLGSARPLVVNFGRSGDSAESIGVLDVLDAMAPDAPRLNITCNPKGTLATRNKTNQLVINLPEATHDEGFAMTSSYSTMLLTALAIFDHDMPAQAFSELAEATRQALPGFTKLGTEMEMPSRMVITGSGVLRYTAREAALKIMELAAGQIPSIWDSSLGFRHGPKSFVSHYTHVLILKSADPDIARYDLDLATELREQFQDITVTIVEPSGLRDVWGGVMQAITCQVIATILSHRLEQNVDNPFEGQGTLSRVVSGVTIYPPKARP